MKLFPNSSMNRRHDHTMERCPYCGALTTIIWVHGHGQCAHCSTNIDECCRGECHPVTMPAGESSQSGTMRSSETMGDGGYGTALAGAGSGRDVGSMRS